MSKEMEPLQQGGLVEDSEPIERRHRRSTNRVQKAFKTALEAVQIWVMVFMKDKEIDNNGTLRIWPPVDRRSRKAS